MFESLENRQFMSVSMTSLTTRPATLQTQPTAAEELSPQQKAQFASIVSTAGSFLGTVASLLDPTATPQQQAGGK